MKAEPTRLTDRLIRYGVRKRSIENETSVTTGRTVTPSTKMEIWGRQGNEFYYISDTY